MLIMTTETLIEFRIILITLRCSYDVVRVERKKGRRRRTALTVKEKKQLSIVTMRSIEQDAQGLRLNMNPNRGYFVDFHWLPAVWKATKSLRAL